MSFPNNQKWIDDKDNAIFDVSHQTLINILNEDNKGKNNDIYLVCLNKQLKDDD